MNLSKQLRLSWWLLPLALVAIPLGLHSQTGQKRDIFWVCDGKLITSNTSPSSIEVRSSFYIGKTFVEQESNRFKICDEQKIQIRFADDCKNPTVSGKIDFVLKSVQIDETLKKVSPNSQHYSECRNVKSPRE